MLWRFYCVFLKNPSDRFAKLLHQKRETYSWQLIFSYAALENIGRGKQKPLRINTFVSLLSLFLSLLLQARRDSQAQGPSQCWCKMRMTMLLSSRRSCTRRRWASPWIQTPKWSASLLLTWTLEQTPKSGEWLNLYGWRLRCRDCVNDYAKLTHQRLKR